jgi:RimJ/RimL family protein N-acetyltransferase
MMSTRSSAILPLTPVTLEGRFVRLEPLSRRHAQDLLAASRDPEIFTWVHTPITSEASFESWLDGVLAVAERGEALPFAIIDRASGRAIGSTRYFDVRHEHRGLEIGYTWLSRAAWRTAINTECKYLLLSHAFERLGCVRVQLRTNIHNARSRAAIERIGGQFEGIIRKHVVNPDGVTFRDTVTYSILDDEWPGVKARLEGRLSPSPSRSPEAR